MNSILNKKNLILNKLKELLTLYRNDPTKKFQSKAVFNAIKSIEEYNGDIISGSQLKTVCTGIGKGISDRIDEILNTGNLSELGNIQNKHEIISLFETITGVGIRRAEDWYNLGYRSIDDIKRVVNNGELSITHHIKLGLDFYDDIKLRIPREEIDKIKKVIEKSLKKIDKKLIFEICGSYRRGELNSGDIDIIITNPEYTTNIEEQNYLKRIIEFMTNSGFLIGHLTEKGDKKYMGLCRLKASLPARRIDIRVFSYPNYWAGLLYFTGNKEFNLRVRNKAIELGYSLNEYALTKKDTNELILLNSENQIFELLHLPYLSPIERRS